MKAEFRCEIVEEIAVLGKSGTTTKELNKVQFGDATPKFDIRSWFRKDGEAPKPLKGTQLTMEEMVALKAALNTRADIPTPTDLTK